MQLRNNNNNNNNNVLWGLHKKNKFLGSKATKMTAGKFLFDLHFATQE